MRISIRYLLVICLVFLNYQSISYGLTCYHCTGCDTNSNTWTTTVTTTVGDSCFKDDISVSVISTVNRGSRSSCTPGTSGTTTTTCCSTDRCNQSISLRNSFIFTLISAIALVLFQKISFY